MDVDDDGDASLRPKQINDYGIKVDFEQLTEHDREVSLFSLILTIAY